MSVRQRADRMLYTSDDLVSVLYVIFDPLQMGNPLLLVAIVQVLSHWEPSWVDWWLALS